MPAPVSVRSVKVGGETYFNSRDLQLYLYAEADTAIPSNVSSAAMGAFAKALADVLRNIS